MGKSIYFNICLNQKYFRADDIKLADSICRLGNFNTKFKGKALT